jgi:Family of unknown function (DUF5995)
MSATTIDEVLARLDGIIEQSIAARDRRGYFAAVYYRVTRAVKAGIAAGDFEDGPRMERFDVTFANRYLDAYDAYQRGEPTTRAWKRAFDAAVHDDLFVLQHLLLGIVAHITLDLGIAAASVAPGAAIASLHDDFQRINDVLASLVSTIENELVSIVGLWEVPVASLLDVLEIDAHGTERSAVVLVLDWARDAAWRFATGLAPLETADEPDLQTKIARQDEQTTHVAEALLLTAPAAELLLHFVRHDVAADIRVLATGELPA